ncbi:MAG: CoA-binding protein [Bacteroidetes bacterium]|jgi:predicted CoA-binding protein|nr:CoA-binding protein [Bacteroidota bacterium]
MKKVLVIGASPKSWRYSYKAVRMLQDYNYEIIALGKTTDRIGNTFIDTQQKDWSDIHTISLYLHPKNSSKIQEYILSLSPKRLIINPGAENPTLEEYARKKGIEVIRACTLVMLSTGQFEPSAPLQSQN